jgi:hypothetical protein
MKDLGREVGNSSDQMETLGRRSNFLDRAKAWFGFGKQKEQEESSQASLSPISPLPEPVVAPAVVDEAEKLKAEAKATELLEQWRGQQEPRGITIILDDSLTKRQSIADSMEVRAEGSQVKQVFHQETTGEETVPLYSAIRRLAGDHQPEVVIVLDGMLSDKYEKGLGVADQLMSDSQSNQWPEPYFIGAASYGDDDKALRKKYPELFLASISHYTLNRPEYVGGSRKDWFDAIEDKLKEKSTL